MKITGRPVNWWLSRRAMTESQTISYRDEVFHLVAGLRVVAERSTLDVNKTLMRFAPGQEHYVHRLRDLGISGCQVVLDAGCGYGQWSLAAARLSECVAAMDLDNKFLPVAKSIFDNLGQGSVKLLEGSTEALPLPDDSVGAIICTEVLYYTDEERTIAEFARMLRQGGRLYILTAGLGYHLEYIIRALRERRRSSFREWSSYVGRSFLHKWLGLGRRSAVDFETRKEVVRLCEQHGLQVLGADAEGTVGNVDGLSPLRRGRFLGFYSWFEVLAQKPHDSKPPAPSRTQRGVGQVARPASTLDALAGASLLALLTPYMLMATLRERLSAQPRARHLIDVIPPQDLTLATKN